MAAPPHPELSPWFGFKASRSDISLATQPGFEAKGSIIPGFEALVRHAAAFGFETGSGFETMFGHELRSGFEAVQGFFVITETTFGFEKNLVSLVCL